MIIRPLYDQYICDLYGKPLIKVLVGQRRVGKSTLLKKVIAHYTLEKSLVIDKEQKIFDHLFDADTLYIYLKKNVTQDIVLIAIDEVQIIRGWETVILSIFSEYPHIEIWITGSNSDMLSSELATRLRGRYVSIMIYPFVYSEFCIYHAFSPGHESMLAYIKKGSMPSLYPLLDLTNSDQRRKDLINTVIIKDIVQRFAIRDVDFIYDIYTFLLGNIGNISNTKSLTNYITSVGKNISVNSLQSYIYYLCDAFLIYECDIYDIQGKKIFERLRKYYVGDAAMKQVYFSGYDGFIGKNIENIVYMTLRAYGWNVFVGKIGSLEVDFVCERYGAYIYIQVAYLLADEQVVAREYGSLEKIQDNRPKYIVSMDQINVGKRNGIEHIYLWELEGKLG